MRTNAELREMMKNKALDGFLLRDEKDAIVEALPALLDQIDALETWILALDAHQCGEEYSTVNDMQVALGRRALVQESPRIEALEAALREIVEWSEAYPIAIFPEPDLSKAHRILTDNGMTLDGISAYVTRHTITRAADIARRALAD